MRIGCLQFAPQVGDVDNNLNRADSVLSKANPDDLDLLVLPELAFTGYNFKSLQDISPFLEPSGSGITSLWARTMALKYNCVVTVGYPEKVDPTPKWPTGPEYYNSTIVVNGDGETIANYRKSFLYYTDESWALEGNRGFYEGFIPGLGNTSIGICMDINPYKFEAAWHAFEFAFHILEVESNLVIVSMAWMTREEGRRFTRMPNEPDMETLTYWVTRLEPLIRSDNQDEIIVVFCNRAGSEDEAIYAGTSAVIGIQDGEVKVYGLLGRGEKELLVVDTNNSPYAKLLYRPDGEGPGKAKGSLEKPNTPGGSNIDKPDEPEKKEDRDGQSGDSKPAEGQDNAPDGKPPSDKSGEHSASPDSAATEHPRRSSSKDATTRGRSPKRQPPPPPPHAPLPPLPTLPPDLAADTPKKRHQAPPITIPEKSDFSARGDSAKSPGSNSFGIPTPSAPSPTPMAMRPRLIIPESPPILPHQYPPGHPISAASERSERSMHSVKSDESEASVQTVKSNPRPPEESTPYPDSGAPLSGYPSNNSHSGKRIYGGHVTISHPDEGFSPTTPFEDISPVSSRVFWRPSDSLLRTPLSAGGWTPGTPIGRKAEPFPWPILKPSSRPQSRNETIDRSKDNATPQDARHANSQSPQSNTSSNRTKRSASSHSSSKTASQGSKSKLPARPSSPKSRNASRTRMKERSDSALSQRDISQHLEHVSQRAESVNKMRGESASNTPVPDRPQSTKSVNCSQSHPNDSEESKHGHHTIPIAASPSVLERGSANRPMSRAGHQRSKSTTSTNGDHVNHERPRTAGGASDFQQPASRAASRGRQPGPKASPTKPDENIPPEERASSADSTRAELLHTRVPRHHSRAQGERDVRSSRHGSRSGRRPSHDPSQFERVEVVVCPNCPAHGQRSASQASSANERSHPSQGSPSELRTVINHAHENGSAETGGAGTEAPADAEKTPVAPKESSGFTDSQDSSATEGTETSDYSSSAETPQTVSTSGRSPATPFFFNPTTPRAMVFTPDENMESFPASELNGHDELSSACGAEKENVKKAEVPHSEVPV